MHTVFPVSLAHLTQVIVQPPPIVRRETLLLDALATMNTGGSRAVTACIFVGDDTQLEGIFTKTDLLRISAEGRSLMGLTLADVMSSPVISIQHADLSDLSIPLNLLHQHQIHQLAVTDGSGRLIGVITQDSLQPLLWERVSEQHAQLLQCQEVEASLRASEAKHHSLINALPDLVIRTSQDGTYLDRIRSSTFDTCWGDDDPIGKSLHDRLPADLADLRLKYIQQALQTNTLQVYEQQLVINGKRRTEEVRINPCGDAEVLVIVRDITARKMAEVALRNSEATNRAIVSAIPDLLIRMNRQVECLDILSGSAVKKVLWLHSEREQLTVYDMLPPHLAVVRSQAIQTAIDTQTLQIYEQEIEIDGELYWEEVRVNPVDEHEALVMIRDISEQYIARRERKQAEERLRQSEAQNRAILSAIPDLMFLVSRDGVYLDYFTQNRYQDVVPATTDTIGRRMIDVLSPEMAQRCMAAIEQALQTRELQVYEQQILIGDRLQDEEVRVMGCGEDQALFMIRDISQQKAALRERRQSETALSQLNQELEARIEQRTAALRESEERWQLALKGSNASLWDWNLRTNQIFRSNRWRELRGLPENDAGTAIEDWVRQIHPDDRDRVMAAFADHLAKKTDYYQEEYRIEREDGAVIWVLDRGQALWDETGTPMRIIGSEMDITRRKRAELETQLLRERLQFVLSSSPAVIFTCRPDDDYAITFISENIVNLSGYTAEEFLSSSDFWARHIHPQDAPRIFSELPVLFERGHHSHEYRLLHKTGHYLWVRNEMRLVRNEQGELIDIVGYFADISEQHTALRERKQAEDQLRKSETHLAAAQRIARLGSWEFDVQTQAIFWSQETYQIFGRNQDAENPTYEEFRQYIHPDDRLSVEQALQFVLEVGQPFESEYRLCRPDGSLRYVLSRAELLLDEAGHPVSLVGTVLDISDRKQLELNLETSQAKLSNVLNSAKAGIIETRIYADQTFEYNYCSPGCETVFGYTQTELMSDKALWRSRVLLEDLPLITSWTENILADRSPLTYDYHFFHKDGRLRWISATYTANREAADCWIVTSVHVDVTERKLAEEALAQKTEELDRFFSVALDLLSISDTQGRFRRLNPQWEATLGYPLQELEGQPFISLVHPDDVERTQRGTEILGQQTPLLGFVNRYRCKDGAYRWIEWRSIPFGNAIYSSARDITERKHFEEQLQKLSDRLALAIRSGAIGIWEWDIVHDVLLWDDRMYELYGIRQTDFSGAYQAWVNGVHPDDRPYADEAINRALLGQREFDIEFRVIHPDGTIHFIKAYGLVQHDRDNNPQRMIGINFDITERKQAEEDLQRINAQLSLTNAELDRATRLKDEFLANMSHELRTPLNAILGMSEGLQEGVFSPLNARQTHAVNTIERSGRHLLELINDILELSKIESGKLELQTAPVSVSYLCETSLSFVRQQAISKNIYLTVEIPKALPAIILDERRIRQVLINLLSNAIKFTPDGGHVNLTVWAEQQANGSFLKLSVQDTGIGIAQDDIVKLFQPFIQIDSNLNRNYEGTGLGLALVRRLTELHGGSVSVSSQLGQGSCFTCCLPYLQEASVEIFSPPIRQAIDISSANNRVLIIEDSSAAAEHISRYLEEQGMQTTVHATGDGFFDAVFQLQPALIILDIQLPNLSGWDVLQQLKSNPLTQEIPVIVISVVDERSQGLALGAAEYLVKPINRQQLQHALDRLKAPLHNPQNESLTPPALEPSVPPLILLAEDNEMNIETISSYLGGLGYRLIYAHNGYEAVAAAQAQQPDLILMDIQMPGMDGLEAMQQIRSIPQCTDLPIIALTALAMPGDRERCLSAGATEYLTKPVRMKQLRGLIQQLLDLKLVSG